MDFELDFILAGTQEHRWDSEYKAARTCAGDLIRTKHRIYGVVTLNGEWSLQLVLCFTHEAHNSYSGHN
jgi:hypothetical protein